VARRPRDHSRAAVRHYSPPTTNRNEYELNCSIEGEEDTLIVSVSRAEKVKELKQVIYREGELEAQQRLLDLAL
jgi:hypothetical protein